MHFREGLDVGVVSVKVLEEGEGELLAWCDPDEYREWVRKNKRLNMEDKVMDLRPPYALTPKTKLWASYKILSSNPKNGGPGGI